MNDDKIYKYVIDSISNIVINGINYYSDKDEVITTRLKDILDYIQTDITPTEKVQTESEPSEPVPQKKQQFSSNDEINEILSSFMKKITDIKISILNLENDLSLYYKDVPEAAPSETHDELEINDILENDEDISISDDENDISIEEVLYNNEEQAATSSDIPELEPFPFNNEITNNNQNNYVQDNKNDIESLEEEVIANDIEERKKSFLDIFKKK